MSKWNLESIKERVKFGDFVSKNGDDHTRRMVIKIDDDGSFRTIRSDCSVGIHDRWDASDINRIDFKFYRNGEEILPPVERELIKFTEKLVDNVPRFLTDEALTIYTSGNLVRLSKAVSTGFVIEEIPNARVFYRYADDLTISHWEEK